MKIAITGGTGFIGRNIARVFLAQGHEVVLLARGMDETDPSIRRAENVSFKAIGLSDENVLVSAFEGCAAVVHCAGINRETGEQTYARVHIQGTRKVVVAARRAGVRKVLLMSFLRARPDCGSGYHESKWAAEEIVRNSGLDYAILKCGVIYGRGDHMLNHLSHAFHTFPVFGFVGFRDKPVRPVAVEDVARIAAAAVVEGALSRQTVAIRGPEEMGLREAVRRVAQVVGRRPLMMPFPVFAQYVLGWIAERVMTVPLVSIAQVRILSEGLAEPAPHCADPPEGLAPRLPFNAEQIRKGLPASGAFGWKDLRCFRRHRNPRAARHAAFMEMP
ncbi:MAG TPA: NAD(P)H-binding protein [Verrucomicrobiota bacterium]|nr:NAD(P)H-binding protein [Verrucomicrobiota bacterium]